MTERFTLIEKIGRGGMGVVWRARDEETGQIVALKLLHSAYSDDPDYVARFERELELARRIHSPNVVQVIGYGVREGTPYLALEYVDGPSLRELLAAKGPYSWGDTKALLVQIAAGLGAAHAAGVVHRDIKPSNVLIGSDGVAKIADFGIARGLDLTRVTGTSTLLGTPAYLPPEGPDDERSDLYSLGIVAYELLVGTPPFEGRTYSEVLMAHVRVAPNLDVLPAEARPIVGWLLAKDPAQRPQSTAELIEALEGNKKVPVRAPVTLAYAMVGTAPILRPADDSSRRGRRRGVLAAGLAGIVLLFATGAVAASYLLLPSSAPTIGPALGGVSQSSLLPSAIPTDSAVAVATETASATPAPIDTPTASPTETPTPTPTPTPKPTPQPTPQPTPIITSGSVYVPAATMWMDAGIAVQAGDQIVFTASGTYWLGPGPSWTPSTINCPPGTPDPRGAAPNIPSSSIVGRVGASGTAFCIGAGATIVAGSSSELYLTINDWVGYYSDNSGGVTVNWQISHQP